jgi:SAM-dependent methyltransferase
LNALLAEQIAYYRARAAEYDSWFFRQGGYDQGPELNARWWAEIAEVRQALDALNPHGRVLELAGGTGIWTERLVGYPGVDQLTVVDASPETLAINRARVTNERVRYVEADLFTWRPDGAYDTLFFGFWLSHVPPERFDEFWRLVGSSLAPDGRVFFVDSSRPSNVGSDHQPAHDGITATRRLDDGREFRIYKLYYRADELAERLAGLGWAIEVRETASYFLYGAGGRPE